MSDESDFTQFNSTYELGKALGRKEERVEVLRDLEKLKHNSGYVLRSYAHGYEDGVEKSIDVVKKRDEKDGS